MNIDLTLAVAHTDADIKQEHAFGTLESLGFVRGFTALDQWFLLVNEGWQKTKLPLNEVVRDYLVTMLHRHMTNGALLERLSAFSYFEYLLGQQKIDAPSTQEVADMCLQCAAFFPGRTKARHEMKSYGHIVDVGVTLYQQLARQSEGKDDWYSRAFKSVADSFGQAIVVLRSACPTVTLKGSEYDGTDIFDEPITDIEAQRASTVMDQIGQLIFENGSLKGTA